MYVFAPTVNGIRYGDPYYDPFWAEAEDLEMLIGIHVSHNPEFVGHHLYSKDNSGIGPGEIRWFHAMMINGDCILAFTGLFAGAVFDRFPNLKVGVVETACGWFAHWFDFMDSKFEMLRFEMKIKHRPSEYFKRQCFISEESDETTIPAMAGLIGADKLVWGSDYPHTEGHPNPVEEIKCAVALCRRWIKRSFWERMLQNFMILTRVRSEIHSDRNYQNDAFR